MSDKIQLKVWIRPDLVQRLQQVDPSHGALSRIVSQLVEEFLLKAETKSERPQTSDL